MVAPRKEFFPPGASQGKKSDVMMMKTSSQTNKGHRMSTKKMGTCSVT
jgi:hypothetical protein